MIDTDLKIEKIPITRTEVFNKLYKAIVTGYFKPGDRLIERDLSDLLGVSRTPIREVLRELERMKLIKSEPYKGVLVNKISIEEADEIFVVRMAVEGLAIRLCVQNISKDKISKLQDNLKSYEQALKNHDVEQMLELDDTFHLIIYEAAKNNTLKEMVQNLRSVIGHFRYITLPSHQEETLFEHTDILNAILSHDLDLAEKSIQNHINAFWTMLRQQFEGEQ